MTGARTNIFPVCRLIFGSSYIIVLWLCFTIWNVHSAVKVYVGSRCPEYLTFACVCVCVCVCACVCVCKSLLAVLERFHQFDLNVDILACGMKWSQYNNNNNNNNRIQRRYSRFFFTISSQRRELSPTRTLKWPGRNRVQITCNTPSAYHVQVSCYVPLGTKGRSAIKFDRVEIAFIWALFYWLNH